MANPNQDANPSYVLLAAGEAYFDRFDAAGASTGEMFLGTVEDLQVGVEVGQTARIFSAVDPSRLLLSEVELQISGKGQFNFRQYNRRNLELAFRGIEGAYTQGSGTLTAVPITGVKKDRWYRVIQSAVHRRNITVTSVTGPSGSPTYTMNTDYKVDSETGRILVVSTGAIADGANLEVNGSYAAYTKKYVAVGDQSLLLGSFRFIGNPNAGPTLELTIPKCVLRAGSLVPLLQQTDFGSYPLEFSILADTTQPTSERFFKVVER